MKITKEQIIKGAKFELKIGTLEILEVEKDGYKKGLDRVFTNLGGTTNFADTPNEIKSFINQNIKK